MEKSLYVITHKKLDNKMPKGRKIMLVGAEGKEVPENYFSDFSENNENISNKNYSFCELTGLYYFTKHDNADVLGLEHYRRFFVKKRLNVFKNHYLTEKKIDKILQEYDVILPKVSTLEMSVAEQYAQDHYGSDIQELKNVIADLYPDYLDAFNSVMNDNKVHFCNMIIGKANIVKDYAKWLFNLLLELEKRIDITDRDTYQKRVFGFLSERLMLVYFTRNNSIKIKQERVLFLENNKPFANFMVKLKRKLKSIFSKN